MSEGTQRTAEIGVSPEAKQTTGFRCVSADADAQAEPSTKCEEADLASDAATDGREARRAPRVGRARRADRRTIWTGSAGSCAAQSGPPALPPAAPETVRRDGPISMRRSIR